MLFEKRRAGDPHWSGQRDLLLRDKGIRPTHIVGDFDSASGDALEYFRRFPEIPIRKFNPVKDLTDTEIAMNLAIELGAKRIFILAAPAPDWIMWWQISSFWPWPSSRKGMYSPR
ncbi:MAG: hypothetical protein ACLR2E_08195 [Lachnospiraceae bacterium]